MTHQTNVRVKRSARSRLRPPLDLRTQAANPCRTDPQPAPDVPDITSLGQLAVRLNN